MSEKRYEMALPDGMRSLSGVYESISGTKPQLEALKARCEEALALAEAEEPKVWDFATDAQGHVFFHGAGHWAFSTGGFMDSEIEAAHPHILGNLKEIVAQGPIVIGMSVRDASALADLLLQHYPQDHPLICSLDGARLRYVMNKP